MADQISKLMKNCRQMMQQSHIGVMRRSCLAFAVKQHLIRTEMFARSENGEYRLCERSVVRQLTI